MAIEITKCNYPSDSALNHKEVIAWLKENATDYFNEFFDGAYEMVCYLQESHNAYIGFQPGSSSVKYRIKSEYGALFQVNSAPFVTYMAKTSYGVALLFSNQTALFITKTDANTTAACCIIAQRNTHYTIAIDLEGSLKNVTESASANSLANTRDMIRIITDRTVLTPVVFDCGSYSPNLFITPFTQREINSGWEVVEIDGVEYLYDGLFALRG